MRSLRRRDLLRVLHEGTARTQAEIVAALRKAGHDVTQATVSRDLREVGAVKLRSGQGFIYRLIDDVPRSSTGDLLARELIRTLTDFAIEIVPAASLVVVKTAPGHAAAVARAIDRGGEDGVAGTVAGDDTIFVATGGAAQARALAQRWSTHVEEEAS